MNFKPVLTSSWHWFCLVSAARQWRVHAGDDRAKRRANAVQHWRHHLQVATPTALAVLQEDPAWRHHHEMRDLSQGACPRVPLSVLFLIHFCPFLKIFCPFFSCFTLMTMNCWSCKKDIVRTAGSKRTSEGDTACNKRTIMLRWSLVSLYIFCEF